jgi:hypothetical protein
VKLRYKIPHRVTCRMVGGKFIGTCSCRSWSRIVDPQFGENLPAGFGITQQDLVADLIGAAHCHAAAHVLEASSTARAWARRRAEST